ncbi:MAG: MotA/TolQ/ExbB proton channel family protein [Candidatus Omnitrophica bacterium]|nr:MotA/TolQ/ExbB proton channel family protein [Candidatus Omnitrophota bacterium]MDE2221996.1 MotA/TolQ/ExbB proton channel family protein [Candidatus Omnitrophota bacterium]
MSVVFTNAWGILLKGGPMIWPILLLSILAVSVGLEKFLFLNAVDKHIRRFRPDFFKAVREGRMKEAMALCEERPDGLGPVCKAGLMKFGFSVDLMRAKMAEAADFEIHALKERMDLLAFVVNAAPLLGLLGTTVAFCVVFHAAQMRSNALNPLSLGDMSSGIWQALVTTSAGLAVGIISFAIYAFCASRVNRVISDFEQTISETVGLLQSVSQSIDENRDGGS